MFYIFGYYLNIDYIWKVVCVVVFFEVIIIIGIKGRKRKW